MLVSKKPMVLVILDGYGYREEQQDNAIFSAKTPVMDALWANRPHTLIDASGLEVGLPDRQMGNSEVGQRYSGRVQALRYVQGHGPRGQPRGHFLPG